MKMKKTVLCLLLSLALVVTFIPMISFAQDEGDEPQGSEGVIQSEEPADPADVIEDTIEDEDADVTEESDIEVKAEQTAITSVTVTIKAPICGTVVKGQNMSQKPQPVAILPSGANYYLGSSNNIRHLLWVTEDQYQNFIGTINGGETYLAIMELRPKEGYVFDTENFTPTSPSGKAFVLSEWSISPESVTIGIYVKAGWDKSYVKKLKVKKGKKSFTVKWKKQSKKNRKKFSGYQIRYATKADMSDAKFKNVSNKKKSKKIKKLAKKTKYYVQVRSYTKTSIGTLYSNWSKVKKVKTK